MSPGLWRLVLTGSRASHRRWTQWSDCVTSSAAVELAGSHAHAESACGTTQREKINSDFQFVILWIIDYEDFVWLPVRLVGGDEAGHITQDATAAFDDGERVGVATMSQRSHQKR